MYKVESPLSINVTKTKKFSLNLNAYRNAHHFTLNKAKVEYKQAIKSQIETLPVFKRISIDYIFYPSTKRHYDVSNVCSIVDKFFCDALVELGHLEDDSYEYLQTVSYSFGSIDKERPRVEIVIKEIENAVHNEQRRDH